MDGILLTVRHVLNFIIHATIVAILYIVCSSEQKDVGTITLANSKSIDGSEYIKPRRSQSMSTVGIDTIGITQRAITLSSRVS